MTRELTEQEKSKSYAKYYYQPMAPILDETLIQMNERGAIDSTQAISIQNKNELLEPGYTDAENGYCLMPDGSGYTAALVDMPGVTKDMIEWYLAWFGLENLRYMIWDTEAHVNVKLASEENIKQRCNYDLTALERRYGTSIILTEDAGAGPVPMQITFLRPEQTGLDMSKLFVEPNVTVNNINMSIGGKPMATATHLYRTTPRGIELRARFWMGYQVINGENVLVNNQIPAASPKGLAYHCIREYSNLASILPTLYAENHLIHDKAEDYL